MIENLSKAELFLLVYFTLGILSALLMPETLQHYANMILAIFNR